MDSTTSPKHRRDLTELLRVHLSHDRLRFAYSDSESSDHEDTRYTQLAPNSQEKLSRLTKGTKRELQDGMPRVIFYDLDEKIKKSLGEELLDEHITGRIPKIPGRSLIKSRSVTRLSYSDVLVNQQFHVVFKSRVNDSKRDATNLLYYCLRLYSRGHEVTPTDVKLSKGCILLILVIY